MLSFWRLNLYIGMVMTIVVLSSSVAAQDSILCLLIYFPTAILRYKARSKRLIAAQDAV